MADKFSEKDWELSRRPEAHGMAVPDAPVRYRMPRIVQRLADFDINLNEVPSEAGTRSWVADTENFVIPYELHVTEDASFIIMETEIARVKSPAPGDLLKELHRINSEVSDAKLVVEFDVEIGAIPACDAIHVVKQFRKQGVPEVGVLREFSAFDGGIERIAPAVDRAVSATSAVYANLPAITVFPASDQSVISSGRLSEDPVLPFSGSSQPSPTSSTPPPAGSTGTTSAGSTDPWA